jgi:hypothetical protein
MSETIPQMPWLSDKHVEDILKHIHGNEIAFEYGCGGSTMFFSKFFKKYVSVEHHKPWYDKMKPHVPENVVLNLREAVGVVIPPFGPGIPEAQQDYINAINETPDIYSFIFIDGRCRVECAKAAMKNMNDYTMLFIHDYERPKYHSIEKHLKLHKITNYDGDHRSLARFSLK